MDTIDIEIIKNFCEEGLLIWSQHAAVRCQQRGIKTSDIENCLINGEIIEKYFDDYPYPSCLILGVTINKQYLHVVCGIGDNKLWIITSYFPSEENWESDRRTRKESK